MNLTITKTREYVWRVVNFGNDAHMASITAWNIVDANTGTIVFGGVTQGNNTKSGVAELPRRKDALAVIEGYQAQPGEANPYSRVDDRHGWFNYGRDHLPRRVRRIAKQSN